MDAMVKKIQKKYRRVKEELAQWEESQSRLCSQLKNAIAIIIRLKTLNDLKYYGNLRCISGIEDTLLQNQLEALQLIFFSIKETLTDLKDVVISLGKIVGDTSQLVKSLTSQQIHMQIGILPTISYCLVGLQTIQEMYSSEYELKYQIISSLSWKCDSLETAGFTRLMVDQPYILSDKVNSIFEIVFADEKC